MPPAVRYGWITFCEQLGVMLGEHEGVEHSGAADAVLDSAFALKN